MNTLWIVASFVVCAGPFTYLALNYATAPASVPMQIGIDGKPTWYGPKQALWAIAAVPLAICTLLGFQMLNGSALNNLHVYFTPGQFLFATVAFFAVIITASLALLLGRLSLFGFSLVSLPATVGFMLMALLG
jgi:hypothetical protein